MQDFLDILIFAYKKLSTQNITLVLLLVKIFFCALGGLIVTYIHSRFSYKWLRNNFNLYVGVVLPIIGLVITTVIGSNIALSIGMIGALSIVRFRTPVRTPYELVHYFSLLTIGISAKVDLGITLVLVTILSLLPLILKKIFFINLVKKKGGEKLSLNFESLMQENDMKEIVSDKNIKNYSVKKDKNEFKISGFATFESSDEKDKFLNRWSSKIINYNVDLDENF